MRTRAPTPAASSRSHMPSRSSSPSSQPSGATKARASSIASRPPRMRGSARSAWANTGGTGQPAPVSRSSSTKLEEWNASSTAFAQVEDAPLAASSARSTPTVATEIVKSSTPAVSSASQNSCRTSASPSAPDGPMHSTPIWVTSRAAARIWPSASRNTRCW